MPRPRKRKWSPGRNGRLDRFMNVPCALPPPTSPQAIRNFLAHIMKDPTSDCWLWTGSLDSKGYGRARYAHQSHTGAHRVAYAIFKGGVPDELQVDHIAEVCTHRNCVNPNHLRLLSISENSTDANVRRRASPLRDQPRSGTFKANAPMAALEAAPF